MKVFWAWQSDTPGKTGRHFVRDALEKAIARLKSPPAIEEPTQRESREQLHLDQDRKGVPGSPDLANIIFEKIEQATVFVADVTPVGAVRAIGGELSPKKLINPNVAIELGFALHALSSRGILMIMNAFYGSHEDLPFDLRHKAGPIQYRLAPDADAAAIKAESAKLTATLVDALADCLASTQPEQKEAQFPETPATSAPSSYFGNNEVLGRIGERGRDEIEFRCNPKPAFYLRLIPTMRLQSPLGRVMLEQLGNRHLMPLMERFNGLTSLNKHGFVRFEPDGQSGRIVALTQAFQNGEVWGINNRLIRTKSDLNFAFVPTAAFERAYYFAIRNYVEFATKHVGISFPIAIEAGGTGLEGTMLATPDPFEPFWGPIHVDDVSHRMVLADGKDEVINAFLLGFFEKLFDLCGHARPKALNSFPPGPPKT